MSSAEQKLKCSSINANMKPAETIQSLVTIYTYEERQEALKSTIIMDDETSHRKQHAKSDEASTPPTHTQQHNIPPPPPQFANIQQSQMQSQSQSQHKIGGSVEVYSKPYAHKINQSNAAIYSNYPARNAQPPSSPTPDYDNIQVRSNNVTSVNRRSMILDSVSIGEYDQLPLRKVPNKFEFLGTTAQKRNNLQQQGGQQSLHSELQSTLSRSTQLRQSNGVTNMEHQSNCPLQNGHVPIAATATATHTTMLRNGSHSNGTSNGIGGGILKHGSRSSISRTSEKSISFGN